MAIGHRGEGTACRDGAALTVDQQSVEALLDGCAALISRRLASHAEGIVVVSYDWSVEGG